MKSIDDASHNSVLPTACCGMLEGGVPQQRLTSRRHVDAPLLRYGQTSSRARDVGMESSRLHDDTMGGFRWKGFRPMA